MKEDTVKKEYLYFHWSVTASATLSFLHSIPGPSTRTASRVKQFIVIIKPSKLTNNFSKENDMLTSFVDIN